MSGTTPALCHAVHTRTVRIEIADTKSKSQNMTRNKLDEAIEAREERIDEYDFESDKFVLEMLEKSKEHHDGDAMMVEEVRAIENAAKGLHRLVTADAFPFEQLEDAVDDMVVVQDEHMAMLEQRGNNE